MVRCGDGSYYVGSTKQPVEARVWEHNNLAVDGYTARVGRSRSSLPRAMSASTDAVARERQIKGWSRRKKEALIASDYEALPDLSRRGHLARRF